MPHAQGFSEEIQESPIVDIQELNVANGVSIAIMVERAKSIIAAAKANNPNLGKIEINVMLGDKASDLESERRNTQALELAKIIHDYSDDGQMLVIEPSAEFRSYIRVPHSSPMEHDAEENLRSKSVRLVAIRRVVVGLITSVSIFIDTESLFSSLLAGVTAGAISGELQRINTHFTAWLHGSAFWDAHGHLRRSKQNLWRVVYGSWRTAKQAAIIAGFITSIYFAALVGENMAIAYQNYSGLALSDFKIPFANKAWLWSTGVPALLSSLSFGRWKQNEAKLVQDYLEDNRIRNFANSKVGEPIAQRVIYGGQLAAIVISASSVLCETLALSEQTRIGSLGLMAVAMASGWTYVYMAQSHAVVGATQFKLLIHKSLSSLKSSLASGWNSAVNSCGRIFE